MTPVLISAYAASPAHRDWDPALEHELFTSLCALPDVAGLEVPWLGKLHPHDDAWFFAAVPAGAELAVTALPFVMGRLAVAPGYGLASIDDDGRSAALDDLAALAADVRRIDAETPATVTTVMLHTAPRGGGDFDALSRSLERAAEWDWAGARLVVEHCDAAVPGQMPEKGFLPLGDEIAAIRSAGVSVGVWLNWGRSVIETRDHELVAEQIAYASASGLLRGLTLSGASAVDGTYGPAWADAHLPLSEIDPGAHSLLDEGRAARAFAAAGPIERYGLKVSRLPGDRTAADVVRTLGAHLDAMRRIAPSLKKQTARR